MLAEPPFSYLDTLDRVDEAIESNAKLARLIVRFGLASFGSAPAAAPGPELAMPEEWSGVAKYQDIDKARSTLRQFYRDWSAEGAGEREACYGPVVRALAEERASRPEASPRLKVLVPGAGLGRLLFDLCVAGYEAEGNEISYHQLLASSYILNYTTAAGQHTIYPWVHTFSNHRTRANHLRGYRVPDIHPGETMQWAVGAGSMAMCAADFLCLYSDAEHARLVRRRGDRLLPRHGPRT